MAEPFRPNIFQPAPSRVSTDPAAKKSHHLHRHNHRHRHSSRPHAAKEAVQSAIQLHPPTSFGDLLNKAKGSGSSTPAHSRRESVQVETKAQTEVEKALQRQERNARKPVRPENLETERNKVKAREGELRSSLQHLSDQSLKTSRRLDDTYYSLLERVSNLHQTLGNLQDLAGLTKELHENFDTETNEITKDIKSQFEAFGSFEEQEEQVAALEARIKAGREKADSLNARLAKAKNCVEVRAKLEAELEARNTRRLRIFWGIVGSFALVILLAILFQQLKPIHADTEHKDFCFASREKILEAPIPDIAKEAIFSSSRTPPSVRIETSAKSITEPGDDRRFRVFDEL